LSRPASEEKNNSTDLTTSYDKQSAREAREVNDKKRPQLDKLITITLIILLFWCSAAETAALMALVSAAGDWVSRVIRRHVHFV